MLCFIASGTGCLECVQGKIKSEDCQGDTYCPVSQSSSWLLQQDNPKHTSASTEMDEKKTLDSEVAGKSPSHNPCARLWKQLKLTDGRGRPSKLREQK